MHPYLFPLNISVLFEFLFVLHATHSMLGYHLREMLFHNNRPGIFQEKEFWRIQGTFRTFLFGIN